MVGSDVDFTDNRKLWTGINTMLPLNTTKKATSKKVMLCFLCEGNQDQYHSFEHIRSKNPASARDEENL